MPYTILLYLTTYIGGHVSWYSKFSGKYLCYFDHLSKGIQKHFNETTHPLFFLCNRMYGPITRVVKNIENYTLDLTLNFEGFSKFTLKIPSKFEVFRDVTTRNPRFAILGATSTLPQNSLKIFLRPQPRILRLLNITLKLTSNLEDFLR